MGKERRCSERVYTGERSDFGGHMCRRKATVEVDGKPHCLFHAKEHGHKVSEESRVLYLCEPGKILKVEAYDETNATFRTRSSEKMLGGYFYIADRVRKAGLVFFETLTEALTWQVEKSTATVKRLEVILENERKELDGLVKALEAAREKGL